MRGTTIQGVVALPGTGKYIIIFDIGSKNALVSWN